MAEQRIANKRLDQDGGAFIDRRLAFNKNNLQILDNGWNNYVLTVDEFGITSLTDANLTSSFAVSASYADTASYAFFALTASFAENFNPAATASYALQALSASFAISSSRAVSSSYALSASFAISASRAVSASSADSASRAISASYALSSSAAISSSYALSASFALTASRAISASYVSGTIAAPGSTTQVIYNSGSVLGADAGFVYSGSRVGIGTTAPADVLHLNGTNTKLAIQGANVAGGIQGVQFLHTATSPAGYIGSITTSGGGSGTLVFNTIHSGSGELMRITNTGFVGIGTNAPTTRLQVRGAGATSATTTFLLQNSTPASIMQVLDNGQFTYSGPLLSLASSQSAFVISQSISQSATVGGQAYGVNITPTFFATTASQTETAFRVNATFTGSASAVSGSNIIADFGASSAGSQLTVTDVTSGSIYMVNDVSGLPIIEATSDWTVNMYNYPNIIFQKTGSVINISGSLRVSGSSVFTGSINVLGAVTATSFTGSLFGTASFAVSSSYATTASHFLGTLNRIVTGSITASVDVGSNIFLIQSSSFTPFSVTNQGSTTVSSSAADMFLVRNSSNNIAFKVSQSGVVVLATQSIALSDPAPAGGIYFTSASFYVALD